MPPDTDEDWRVLAFHQSHIGVPANERLTFAMAKHGVNH
jgi:hypothetical protein